MANEDDDRRRRNRRERQDEGSTRFPTSPVSLKQSALPRSPRRDLSNSTSPKSPTPDGEKKIPAWKLKGNGGISFQATPSPTGLRKPKVSLPQQAFTSYTSFLDKDASSTRTGFQRGASPLGDGNSKLQMSPQEIYSSFLDKDASSSRVGHHHKKNKKKDNDVLIADIKIEAKIPNIDAKLRQRRLSQLQQKQKQEEEDVPEHIRKFRAREEARLAALNEQERNAELVIKAISMGWYTRTILFPRKKAAYEAERRKRAEAEAMRKRKVSAAVKIQSVFRGFCPRKQFKREIAKIRKRAAHEQKIKSINERVAQLKEETKQELKRMKKEHLAKKKALKQKIKEEVRNDEHRLQQVKESGHDVIQGLQEDNRKLREQGSVIKKDSKFLAKQANLLRVQRADIDKRIKSLREYVEKTEDSIQKREIQSQKCRLRYLPKFRDQLAERGDHCINEHRVKVLYRENLYRICKSIQDRCEEEEVRSLVVSNILECESEINRVRPVPMPDGLKKWLGEK